MLKILSKIIIVILLLTLILTLVGCRLFDLTDFVLPNDNEFEKLVESLTTPELICGYMENFNWNWSIHAYSPYQMYLANLEDWNDTGDCDDFATFGIFVANYHGYETYRMRMWCKYTGLYGLPLILPYVMGVYVEDGKYTYSNNSQYWAIFAETFEEIIIHHVAVSPSVRSVISWKVYDYYGNLIPNCIACKAKNPI